MMKTTKCIVLGLSLLLFNETASADCASRVSQARSGVEQALSGPVSEVQWQRLAVLLEGLCTPRQAGDSVAVHKDQHDPLKRRRATTTYGLNPKSPPATPVPVPPIIGVDLDADKY